MNSNQLKLNLNTMKTTRQDAKTQTIKYYNFLENLKTEIENKKNISLQAFCHKHKVSVNFSTFLLRNSIISKKGRNFYTWNEKIPVTNLLVKKFRVYTKNKMEVYREKNKNTTCKNDVKIIKGKPKLIKQHTKVIYSVQKQEIGLIRKFLKWIY